MTRNEPFAHAQIHHIALRVDDAKASKDWFLTKLDFHVDREFSFNGMDFVWLCPKESTVPVIELIGGGIGPHVLRTRMPRKASSNRVFIIFAFRLTTSSKLCPNSGVAMSISSST